MHRARARRRAVESAARIRTRAIAAFGFNVSDHTAIALIIPSLGGDVEPLLASVRRQTLQPSEIEVVRGVRPNGRARNQGVAYTSAPLLMFVDDDAVLGDEHVIERLVAPLLADPSIGVTGASK